MSEEKGTYDHVSKTERKETARDEAALKNVTEMLQGAIPAKAEGSSKQEVNELYDEKVKVQEELEQYKQAFGALSNENRLLKESIGDYVLQVKYLQNEIAVLKTEKSK